MSRTFTQTIVEQFLALESGGKTTVTREVDLLAPLFAAFATVELALLELHASMLRHAARQFLPEEFTDGAAIVFGLARAVQRAQQPVPDEVVLNAVAHTMCAALTPGWDPSRARHLDLARSWLAHAYLVAGIDAGGAR